jgi:hypothetical protein
VSLRSALSHGWDGRSSGTPFRVLASAICHPGVSLLDRPAFLHTLRGAFARPKSGNPKWQARVFGLSRPEYY